MASDDINKQTHLEPTFPPLQADKMQRFLRVTARLPVVCLSTPRRDKEIRKMRKYLLIVMAALILGFAVPTLNADTTYDLVTGFSSASNPNGVWTYDHNGTAFTAAQGSSSVNGSGLPGWWTGLAVPNSQVVGQNVTGSTFVSTTLSLPTGNLWMDPESGSVSVLFTAPSAGTYAIAGSFLGIDTVGNSHPVSILDDGTVVWSGTIATYLQADSFSFSETLNAGDVITFDVGTGTGGTCTYCFLSTGLSGSVTEKSPATSTPEPGTVALICFGLGFLFVTRKRISQDGHQAA